MEVLTHTRYYEGTHTKFTLYPLFDLHVGAKAMNETLLRHDIARIAADPNALWIGGGDYIDAICQVGDKRYRPSTLATWLHGVDDVMSAEVEYCAELLKPIASKCIGLIKGNHEDDAFRYYTKDTYWDLVKAIAAAGSTTPAKLAMGVHGFIELIFRYGAPGKNGHNWVMTIYGHHGYGGGRLPGSHALTLGRVLSDYDCDLALMGHRHVFAATPKTTASAHRGKYKLKTRIGMFVPSYLESWLEGDRPLNTYAENKGLPASAVGTHPIEIFPFQRRFHLSVSNIGGLQTVE